MDQTIKADKLLRLFLEELILEIVTKFNHEIVSIALFGSAATGEWVKGESDVDFVVVIKHHALRRTVEDYVYGLLLKLDRKYALSLIKTCSIFARHKNPIISLIYKIESLFMFGRPFYVFSIDQIHIEKGTVSGAKIRFIAAIFDPLSIFLAKMKQTGVIIYGENLIERIRFSNSKFVKARIALAPLWILVVGVLSLPLDEMFALKHFMKATLWACEDVLFALDMPLSTYRKEICTLEGILNKNNYMNLNHARRTIALRNHMTNEKDISKGFVAKYALYTLFFIFRLYYKVGSVSHLQSRHNVAK